MNKQKIFLILGLVIITGTSSVFLVKNNQKNDVTITKSKMLFANITKDELLQESDVVLIGTVGDHTSFIGPSEIRPNKEDIFSDFELSIDEYIYNPKNLSEQQITIRVTGGTVGDITTLITDGPNLEKDDKIIVFLKQQGEIFEIVGWAQGKYTIDNGAVGKDYEKNFIKNIFGKELTVNEFKQEILQK